MTKDVILFPKNIAMDISKSLQEPLAEKEANPSHFFAFLKIGPTEVSKLTFLGPFFLFLTLYIASIKQLPLQPYFLIVPFFGFILSFKWKAKSLFYTLGAYFIIGLFCLKGLPFKDLLWGLGFFSSLTISHFISILVLDEHNEIWSKELIQKQENLELIAQMKENENASKEALQQQKSEWEQLLNELEKWKAEASQRLVERKSIENLLQLSQQEAKDFSSQKKEILEELHVFKKLAQERLEEIESLRLQLYATPLPLEDFPQVEEAANFPALYKQLRTQFEEKSKTLDLTRKELFQKEGQIQEYSKILEEVEEQSFSDYQYFVSLIKSLEEEKENLQQEIILLESLI